MTAIVAVVLAAYFFQFVGPGLNARFAADDPMNIYYYWSKGPLQFLKGAVLFFSTYYRPMGGVYFGLLYHFFGLDPFPYHVVTTALILLNSFLAYRLVRLLTKSRLAGALGALLAIFHPEMQHLIYMPAFVFDVLCFSFFFLALNYYMAIRERGEPLTKKQTLVFLLLYLGALESKEMAVTLPGVMLLYEALWHAPVPRSLASMLKWLRVEALPLLLAGALTLVYVVGKIFSPDSLARVFEAYRPILSWDRYVESTTRFVNTLLYQPAHKQLLQPAAIVVFVALLITLAWWRRNRALFFGLGFAFITPLPITFIPGRGGSCLYIPLIGWALIAIVLLFELSDGLSQLPLVRRAGTAVPRGLLVMCAVAWLWAENAERARHFADSVEQAGSKTRSVLEQIRAIQPGVKPGSRIYVMNDVFEGWDTKFLFELNYHDRTVDVWLGAQAPLPPEEIEKHDYVFAYEDGRLKRLKGG